MSRSKENKGITLIALIITIVILLILAVVTIMEVTGDGIIAKAKEAKTKYKEEQTKENVILGNYLTEMENLAGSTEENAVWVDNGNGTFSKGSVTVSIGDYINYDHTKDVNGNEIEMSYISYSSQNASSDKNDGRTSGYWESDQTFNLKSYKSGWRILGLEDGSIKLISADIIGPDSGGYTNGENAYYYLAGDRGHTYGPDELNIISNMYAKGAYATSGKSINLEEIKKATDNNVDTTSNLWKLLFENTDIKYYWLADQYSDNSGDGRLQTGMYQVINESSSSMYLRFMMTANNVYRGVRPIVYLENNIKIEKNDINDGSTLEKACIIK